LLLEKEWIFLNEVTHMIHDTQNLDKMRTNLLELLTILLPHSSSSFYLASPERKKLFYDPVTNNMSQKDVKNYLAYGEGLDYTVPIFKSGRPIAYRETDLFEGVIREKTDFYNEFLAHGLEYPIALCIAEKGICYGALSLFRSKKMGDFSDRDVFILNQLQKHLATKIRHEYAKESLSPLRNIDLFCRDFPLTGRETEIIKYILDGLSNKEIADALFIESGTVKKHIHNIYGKLNLKNRIHLVKFFLKNCPSE
jgi:DNA-binding CsgD family transcriptional regulator